MIRLGDTVRFQKGFIHKEGTCKQLELLKWSKEDALVRGHKYLVLGIVCDEKNNKIGRTFLTEGTLTYCRKFVSQLLHDEDVLVDS